MSKFRGCRKELSIRVSVKGFGTVCIWAVMLFSVGTMVTVGLPDKAFAEADDNTKTGDQSQETEETQKIDEQEKYLERLQKYPPDGIGKVNYVKKLGSVKYPVKERDTAINCLNGEPIKMPADLKQFLFSGCEDVSLSNWKGKYETVKYDEIWTYELFNTLNGRFISRVEVYWENKNFVLEIGYYSEGYINYIRDRVYYENSIKSEH